MRDTRRASGDECDPAAGLWRKHPKHVFDTETGADGEKVVTIGIKTPHNAWQIEKMPIKASFCDNWFAACQDDKFCDPSNGGDFFSCSREYKALDESSKGYTPGIIAAIPALGVDGHPR